MRTLLALPAAALVPVLSPGSAALAAEPQPPITPYSGVTYTVWDEGSIPARLHVVEIDLTSAEIHLRATEEGQRGQTPSSYAASSESQIVINGDFFSPTDFAPSGLARGDGTTWSISSDDDTSGFVSFYKGAGGTIAELSSPEEVVTDVGEEVSGVVGGRPMLVRAGLAVTSHDCEDLVAMPCERAPRTAVALSQSGDTSWLVVVDGWQAGSLGMTASELGAFLEGDLGAHDALMLDSGSSSALYIEDQGGVVSSPSDGVERAVANHLGVHHGALPAGSIVGVVRDDDSMGEDIDGALVELDDGRTTTFSAGSLWSFDVAPRWACVTGSAPGYLPRTECRQVPPGDQVFASLFLDPADRPDAGPGAQDAAPLPDGPIGPGADGGAAAGDGGPGGGGSGGCACRSAGTPGASPALVLAVLVLASRLRR